MAGLRNPHPPGPFAALVVEGSVVVVSFVDRFPSCRRTAAMADDRRHT
jgi:hypothetical protein